MIRSLTSGISGMQQFQQRLDVIGNNISNVNTTGYKSARVDFQDAFSQTMQAASPSTGNSSAVAGIQIGSGVSTGAIRNQFTQGAVTRTGVQTDLAVNGGGFFIVKDPVSGSEYATRSGDFRIDQNGYLITNTGHRVQGFTNTVAPGNENQLVARGDLQINMGTPPATLTIDPDATLSSYDINPEGIVTVRLSDGSQYIRGQVLLQGFSDPQALMKEGGNLYSGLANGGPVGANGPVAPGSNGLGKVQSGALELSNVDLASEFSSMITTQRAFQASARIISTSDEILQELVNLKR
jgi:flagellar hook protein FlgE